MDKKCIGCGVLMQNKDINMPGYVDNLDAENIDYCKRCFKIKYYNDYQRVVKDNSEYINILNEINKTKDLVVYVADIFNLNEDVDYIKKYLSNNILLVLNKRDILPLSLIDERIIDKLNIKYDNYEFILMISGNKNYNIDNLLEKIYEYKKSNNVYIVGNTNAGKSTLVNKLIKNYSTSEPTITISPLSSTTLDKMEIVLNEDITLIDTPGLLDEGNMIDFVDMETLKRITPKKEIKPMTYQLYEGQTLIIDNLLRVDYVAGRKNSFTLFTANNLKVEKVNMLRNTRLQEGFNKQITIRNNEDIVIKGLGFIKVMNNALIDIYCPYDVKIYQRRSII
jgi:30S ribosome assembly GTPase